VLRRPDMMDIGIWFVQRTTVSYSISYLKRAPGGILAACQYFPRRSRMNNDALQTRRLHAVPRGIATAYPRFVARADNSEIWDVEGMRYVDFAGGIAVLNTSHLNPNVIEAVRNQLDAYTHTDFQILPYERYVELCERLARLAPIDDAK